VVEHIRRFRDAGVPDTETIVLFGVARNTFYRALRGEDVRRGSEQRILLIPVPARREQSENRSCGDATGTHRRLCALMAMGWPQDVLERRLRFRDQWITASLRRRNVSASAAASVKTLYDELWNQRPEQLGLVLPEDAEESRERAASRGWVGPLAWDDDTIDDPAAVPMLDAEPPAPTSAGEKAVARWLMGESVVLDQQGRREAIAHLMEWTTDSPEQIAARLESTPDAVSRAWERIKSRARQEGRPVPWRRKLEMARRNELTKREMETAA